QLVERPLLERVIDTEHHHGVRANHFPSHLHIGDVDTKSTQHRSDCTDDSGTVDVVREEHSPLGFHTDGVAVDLCQHRTAPVGDAGDGTGATAPFKLHRDRAAV